MEGIIITKNFKLKNYIVELKDDLEGIIIYNDNHKKGYFKSDSHNIKIILDEDGLGAKTAMDIKHAILDIYLKGMEDISLLNEYEIAMFYFIKNVDNIFNTNKKILFIGYKNNYISTIKTTLSRYNCRCDVIELDKNIELYKDDYSKILLSISMKMNNSYDKIVLDIPNVRINNTDYNNTKTLIDIIESSNKKLLLIVQEPIDRFFDIFGEKYKDIVLKRDYAVYCGYDHITMSTIKRILF